MHSETLSRLLDSVKGTAIAAGKAILPIAAEVGEVAVKSDGSPLTRADLASHDVIQAGLEPLAPKFPILSEEGDVELIEQGSWKTYWCVDPLDGTKEFVKGLDEYTVNIALIDAGAAILGVVYVPAKDALYYAARGLGAWKVEADQQPQRIRPSRRRRPRSAVVSRSHLSDETRLFLERLGIENTLQHGSSIKICAVAEGKADIYPRHGPTCLWDTAAGAAVALAAGCFVVDLAGAPLSYDLTDGVKRSGFLVYPPSLDDVVRGQLH